MDNLEEGLKIYEKNGLQYMQTKISEAELKVAEKTTSLNGYIKEQGTEFAMLNWMDIEDKTYEDFGTTIPPYIKYGEISLKPCEMLKSNKNGDIRLIPLLLSTQVDALFFDFKELSSKVPYIFQNVILRLLLTMRMDLVKVSIVDMDFGRDFSRVASISNSIFNFNIITGEEGVSRLIKELELEMANANKIIRNNIEDHNTNDKNVPYPYHFVFIDDFPSGFSPNSISSLIRMIRNGNASRIGVKIFINYNESNYNNDYEVVKINKSNSIDQIKNICSCVIKEQDKFSFVNLNIDLPPEVEVNFETELSEKTDSYIDFFKTIKKEFISCSLDVWIEEHLSEEKIWKGDVSDGIQVPIGFISPEKIFEFKLANDNDPYCNDFFALVAGDSGQGKTTFLDDIITNAAIKYSPEDLHLYLADFADGSGFNKYQKLPHVKTLMLDNNKEFAYNMLKTLKEETSIRARLYREAENKYNQEIRNLSRYRRITGNRLPRILLVMDEFHSLFIDCDDYAQKSKILLNDAIRQFRKFGISIIFATQKITGVNFGEAEQLITYRFAMKMSDVFESKYVIRNSAATSLRLKGEVIMNNTPAGEIENNIQFRAAWAPSYLEYINRIAELYKKKYGKESNPYIFVSNPKVCIEDNKELYKSLDNGQAVDKQAESCNIYVGKPDLLREEHTKITLRNEASSHTLMLGDDYLTILSSVLVQMLQIYTQSIDCSRFYIVDSFSSSSKYKGSFRDINEKLSKNFYNLEVNNIAETIDSIYEELENRKTKEKAGEEIEGRIVLTILNIQNCDILANEQYGPTSNLSKKLSNILSEGARFGIHCIIHAVSFEILAKKKILDITFTYFENKILLQGASLPPMPGVRVEPFDGKYKMAVIVKDKCEKCVAYSSLSANEDYKVVDNKLMNYMQDKFNELKEKDEN